MGSLFAKVAVDSAVYAVDRLYDYAVPESMREKIAPGMRVIVPFGQGNRKTEGFALAVADKSDYPKAKAILALPDETPVLDEKAVRLALWVRDRFFCTFFEAARAMLPAGLWHTMEESVAVADGVEPGEAMLILTHLPQAKALWEKLQELGGRASADVLRESLGGKDPAQELKVLADCGLVTAQVTAKRRVGDKTQKKVSLAISEDEAMRQAQRIAAKSPLRAAVLRLLCQTGPVLSREVCYFTGASPVTLTNLQKAGFVTLTEQEVYRRPKMADVGRAEPVVLNEEQQKAFDGIAALMGKPACALLHGVTGSGKTSVYLELIRETIAGGGAAIVMAPEIALTPQLLERFCASFGDRVALLHSGLSLGERLDEWKRIRAGEVDVVVGTRSAVFAPLANLRLIILDEEQEATYKSENAPRYHAREVAKFRCVQHDALLLLGSATPSVESCHFAREGSYGLFRLDMRYNRRELPRVLLADMREELKNGNGGCISAPLMRELEENIRNGQQSILFLNRRGYNRALCCGGCGFVPECPRCSVSLTFHMANGRMMCHTCGHSEKKPEQCPQCGGAFRPVGEGTQRAEEELAERFPGVPLLRMDTDTTSGRDAHEKMLSKFRKENIPILLGTQMVTKGLDFENVTLVGALSADSSLFVDDFRAHERTFDLITQVVGRAGRGRLPGRAIIQTFSPAHPILRAAAAQDYDAFFENEIELRKMHGLPPFCDIVTLRVVGIDRDAVLRACMRLRGRIDAGASGWRVLGPAPAPVLKAVGMYRYHITLLGKADRAARDFVSGLLLWFAQEKQNRGVSVSADSCPM